MEEFLKQLKEDLKRNLSESERMWNERKDDKAFIIGWLQGTVKGAISDIEKFESINKK